LLPVDDAKLKVVNLPTRVVQYCRHPLGGLHSRTDIKLID